MKKFFPILAVSFSALFQLASAQSGSVGIGTNSPNPSSILDVSSVNKGVLLPRMTQAQRDSIVNPAAGLLIYQTDNTPGFYYYRAGWKALTPATVSAANKSLSNLLAPTAINASLLPAPVDSVDLGNPGLPWRDIYLNGDLFVKGNRFVADKGSGNNFFGTSSGANLAAGIYNTAAGYQALYSNTNGYANTATGYLALYANTGTYNTADGYVALYSNTTGYANSASGAFGLYANTTGSYNVGFGADVLLNNSTGNNNTAVGLDALHNITSTGLNTAIGYYAGDATYDAIQGTFLGAQTRGGTGLSNMTAVGYGAIATASNQVMLGNSAVTSVKAAGSYVIYSDGRFKRDIKQDVPGLTFINKLRPVTYHYNIHDLDAFIAPSSVETATTGVNKAKEITGKEAQLNEQAILAKERKLYTGFVAQEVEAAAKKLNYDFSGLYTPANDKDPYGLSYSDFVAPLVKSVQELSKANDDKTAEIELMKQKMVRLEAIIQQLQIMMAKTASAAR